MKQARKKFLIYAVAAVAVLLVSILSVINAVNFTMAADDADRITEQLAQNRGEFNKKQIRGKGISPEFDKPGSMGPGSPDMNPSVRYFTVKIDNDNNAEETVHQINAFTTDEAIELAKKLQNETTGWTNTTYRYRVYKDGDLTFVTVIDWGRELLPSYRILKISLLGIVTGIAVSIVFLTVAGKKLFEPLEEADRKQKNFIRDAETEFRVPLTVISANTEIIEKEHGSDEFTVSTHRQIKKMTDLVKRLSDLAIFDAEHEFDEINLSEILRQTLEQTEVDFSNANIQLKSEIEETVIKADKEKLSFIIDELLKNGIKFSSSFFTVTLSTDDSRIILKTQNDTSLPDGEFNMIFDRFTRLKNADGKDGNGLGLAYVKDIVKEQNGRVSANSSNGIVTITVTL